jgi:protein tyrosine/serine phosphatase
MTILFDYRHRVADPTRIVPTTGVHNFRDYGGYPLAGGGRLARGLLYRSGEHARATDRDLDIIGALGLDAVIDLRGSSERQKAPCRRPPGFTARVICADGETTPMEAPHVDAAADAFDATAARRNMLDRYAGVAFRPLLAPVYREFFHTLARTTGPTLVNCSAGKDRTGVLVALLHAALGVHPDDMMADYLLTNTVGDVEARVAALRDDLQHRFGRALPEEAVRVVTMVEPGFLQAALDSLAARHGSVQGYLEQVLGVTPAVRATLAGRLTA